MSSKHVTRFRRWFLSSPPAEWATNQLRELTIGALRQGPIPQHVAFEMDGNRRYARSQRIETVEGHYLGFEAMARVCLPTQRASYSLTPSRELLRSSTDPRGVLQIRGQSGDRVRLQHRELQAIQIRSRRPYGHGKIQAYTNGGTWRTLGPIWSKHSSTRPTRTRQRRRPRSHRPSR